MIQKTIYENIFYSAMALRKFFIVNNYSKDSLTKATFVIKRRLFKNFFLFRMPLHYFNF